VLLVVMGPNSSQSEERSEVSSPCVLSVRTAWASCQKLSCRCVLVQEKHVSEETCRVIVRNILKHENPFVTSKHFANLHIIFVPFGFVN
jgi:hypothetical protein